MMLFENEEGLPKDVLGAVLPEQVSVKGIERYLFAIVINRIKNPIVERLTMAHELAHALLHSRLIRSGTVLADTSAPWLHYEGELRQAIEVEANVFSLVALIPPKVITAVRELTRDTPSVEAVQYAVSVLYGTTVRKRYVEERMLIQQILDECSEKEVEAEFERFVGSNFLSSTEDREGFQDNGDDFPPAVEGLEDRETLLEVAGLARSEKAPCEPDSALSLWPLCEGQPHPSVDMSTSQANCTDRWSC